jgi:hypothetical protein
MRVRPYHCRSKTGRVRIQDSFNNWHTILDETGNTVGELKVLRFIGVTENRAAHLSFSIGQALSFLRPILLLNRFCKIELWIAPPAACQMKKC